MSDRPKRPVGDFKEWYKKLADTNPARGRFFKEAVKPILAELKVIDEDVKRGRRVSEQRISVAEALIKSLQNQPEYFWHGEGSTEPGVAEILNGEPAVYFDEVLAYLRQVRNRELDNERGLGESPLRTRRK